MPFLERNDCRLHYLDVGSGEPCVLFLHGWCDEAEYWQETMALLKSSGLSTRGKSPSSLSKEQRSLRYGNLASLDGSDEAPGVKRYSQVFRLIDEN